MNNEIKNTKKIDEEKMLSNSSTTEKSKRKYQDIRHGKVKQEEQELNELKTNNIEKEIVRKLATTKTASEEIEEIDGGAIKNKKQKKRDKKDEKERHRDNDKNIKKKIKENNENKETPHEKYNTPKNAKETKEKNYEETKKHKKKEKRNVKDWVRVSVRWMRNMVKWWVTAYWKAKWEVIREW
ncbi:hypothetical protein KSF78_0009612 [Schistosoma japonicum]|nr:hypothetical protein KSF78_0009612 [Schistosoma japonicum]